MIPGCNITTYPKDVNPQGCCPSMPKCSHDSLNSSVFATCKTNCPPTGNHSVDECCMTKCIFTQLGLANSDGSFNSTAAVAQLTSLTSNPTAWSSVFQSAVSGCVANGEYLY